MKKSPIWYLCILGLVVTVVLPTVSLIMVLGQSQPAYVVDMANVIVCLLMAGGAAYFGFMLSRLSK